MMSFDWLEINSRWAIVATIDLLVASPALIDCTVTTVVILDTSSVDCIANTATSRTLSNIIGLLAGFFRAMHGHLDTRIVHHTLGTSMRHW